MPFRRLPNLLALAGSLVLLAAACGDESSTSPPRSGDADQTDSDGGGLPDGGLPDSDENCVDDDGDGYGDGCSLGFDCNDGSDVVYQDAIEACDGVDNNCDDVVDEDCPCADGSIRNCYEGEAGTLGLGRCSAGYQICDDDEWGSCQSQTLPQTEVCDSIDNNCDGDADEGVTNACGTCSPNLSESCGDGLDNDCDGTIDESDAGCDCDDRTRQPCYGGPPQTLGVGACRGGTFDCVDGAWGRCRGQVLATDEVCDGLDNDCDGLVDEGLVNACGDCGVPDPREVCDGLDNDCDGLIDEGLVLACGLCTAEGLEETCGDGLDNDCDGIPDEGCACTGDPACYPGPPDTRGVGACQDGTRRCDGSGEFWGECEDYQLPQPEICDGQDNDCDGLVDISPLGCNVCNTDAEVCDGIDNDCDGRTDEFLLNSCGQCLADVTPEEDGGIALCDGQDNDCDGLIDEELVNACGACDDSCYEEEWSAGDGTLDEGDVNGLDDDTSEGLRLGVQPFIYPYLWVANSGAATVTKINTQEGTVDGTYPVGIDPSRTAVDLDGNVWVANRAFNAQGSVTKIQAEDCTGNDCVLFTRNIGAVGDIPRGLAIDENNFAWVGTYNGKKLYQLASETGEIVYEYPDELPLPVYGLAVDSESILWISSIAGTLGAFDIEELRFINEWSIPDCSSPYGIAVDGNGNVWLGNWTCDNIAVFDPDTETFTTLAPTSATLDNTRGVAVDDLGYIWTVATNSDRLGRYDPATEEWRTFDTCDAPMGVGVTGDGTIWTPCWNSEVYWFDQLGAYQGTVTAGVNPYSYSDMTGFQLRTFTARQGTWTVIYDCGRDVCTFDTVSWDASTPAGTSVRVRARSSFDLETWSSRVGPFETTPASLDELPDGRYVEVEVTLTTTDEDISPVVSSVEVQWQRP